MPKKSKASADRRSLNRLGRRAHIDTMMRIPHDPQLPMYQIWHVVASNGRHLCECKSESAATLIVNALNTPNAGVERRESSPVRSHDLLAASGDEK